MQTHTRQLSLFDEPATTVTPLEPMAIEADPNVIALFGKLPPRLLMMHRNFGSLPGEHCFACKFFWNKPLVDHRECLWYHGSKHEKTNWIASWPACDKREPGDSRAEGIRQGRS